MKIKGKKFLVVGLGKTGVSATRFILAQGGKVTITDSRTRMELAESIKLLGDLKVEMDLGKHNPKLFTQNDVIVLSPGVPGNIEGLS
ncbi:MAG TPA: UDP-N-acetylmuramoyl-L-alanine--D-glutamate ligase, partial [Oligoflexia bacterium]|nr:UDP-N-acetylmuramoyl-L-alanine--D-glutamate ligase [Oligoflexia bacterium]